VVVDLDLPLPDFDTSTIDALHVTVFSGSRPLGRVVLPTGGDVCTAEEISPYVERFRAAAFAAGLQRSLDPPPNTTTSASIVVCTRGRPDRLRACLRSLAALTAEIEEIIVVHNSTDDDGTGSVVAEFGFRYVREPELGLDRARNRGVVEASTDVVLFTDDDVQCHPEWARWLLGPFADDMVAAVTGLVLPAELATAGQIEFERLASFIRTFGPFVLDGAVAQPALAGRVGSGASMAFRRSFFLRSGGFPDCLDGGQPTSAGGDTYAFHRALKHGFRIAYEPRAVTFHTHRTSREESLRVVHGYAVGFIAHLLEAAIKDRDPAPLVAALRWTRARFAVLLRGSPGGWNAIANRYVRAQIRGGLHAPLALWQGRRATRPYTPYIVPTGPGYRAIAPRPDPPYASGPISHSVSVIIATQGRSPSLEPLLRALGEQQGAGEVEVIVARPGPDPDADPTVLERARHPGVRIVVSDQATLAAARNAGAAAARNDLLVFLVDDAMPDHPYVLAAHRLAHADEVAVAVGPIIPTITKNDALTLTVRSHWTDRAARVRTSSRLDFVDVSSANLSITRATFERIGGFDSRAANDAHGLAWRAAQDGVVLRGAPGAATVRTVAVTARGLADRSRREGRADVEMWRAHPGAAGSLRIGAFDEPSPWSQRARSFAVASSGVASRTAVALTVVANVLDRLGSRWLVARVHEQLIDLSYWAGVGEEAGGAEAWNDLRVALAARRDGAPRAELDLGELAGWSPPAGEPARVKVTYRGIELGEVRIGWRAGVPFDRYRFGSEIIDRFAADAFRVETRLRVSAPAPRTRDGRPGLR
jgi:GT2 family glycosyltransferase